MPVGRRYELINWAAANDSYIIEDDYDSELRYFGRPIPALKSLKGNDRVIYLGSFSTTLFAAVKNKLYGSAGKNVPPLSVHGRRLFPDMLKDGAAYPGHVYGNGKLSDPHKKSCASLYSQKLAAASDILAGEGRGFIDMRNKTSGINILLKVSTKKTGERLRREAQSLMVPAVPLEDSDLLILYYNQIPLERMAPVLKELVALWRSR